MTSTNVGNDVKNIQTSGPKGKSYYIELYKSLETRLSEAATAGERTRHLCEAWRRVHSLCLHSAPTTHPHLLSWLQRHTARTVLQTKWQTPERKDDRSSLEEAINVFIVESKTAAANRDDDSPPWELQLVARGEWFKRVLEHPWKHPVLNCLLNPDETPPTNDEVLEWLKEERGVTFVMRLHTLVTEKCDDIAMSLASAVMERVRGDTITMSDVEQSEAKDKPENEDLNLGDRLKEEAGFTVDVWEMLTDIEFVLLHKRDSSRCITLAKQTPLRTAYQLIERLQSRLETSPREKRLWKNSKEVAVLIAQVVIARCMVVPACTGGARSALYCCARSLARLLGGTRLPAAAAALAAPAPTAAHLHTLAAAVDAQLAQKNETSIKPFVCELYVRAITAGMNELERLKLKTEKDMEARSMEQTLASWFVQLGAVLSTSDRVKCECALTAFSVHPSPQMYERIKAAPALPPIHLDLEQASTEAINPEFGSWASDSRSQTNFVKTSETLNMKARQNQANVLSTAILTEGEALGLSPELCQDITVLLSGPRVKTLSWDMDRELLLENCRAYLERTHGGTKAVTTELKYLNLNPADFQYLPEEDEDESNIYYGIEKGYEHLVEFQEPENIWEDAYENLEQTESYSSDEYDFIQPQRKKKTKKPVEDTEESDPLSLVAETKRKEKKERPHSKERSKKKATDPLDKGDPLDIQEGNQEKKKEKPKRERKKKAPKPTDESLANLVGLKVGKAKKQAKNIHTDSEVDSQRRSSIRSVNSEETLLYDGLYSMDEMRSPRSSHSSDSMSFHNEFSRQMGITNTKSIFNRPHRPPSVSGLRIASPSPAKSQSPSDHSRNNSPTFISDEVKGSISRLLEFRRQKALEAARRKPNAIMRPDGSMAMDKINISPKGVAIPEIPKSYINKQSDKSLLKLQQDDISNQRNLNTAIPSPVIQYASKSPTKPCQSHYGSSQYNNIHADRMTASSERCFSTPSSDRFLDSVNLVSIYNKNVPTHSRNPYHRSSNYSEVPRDRQTNVDMSYVNYQNYLHEFSLESFNQYAEKRDANKKVMRPVSRVTPVVPNKKSEHKTPQSAKQMPQKKPDGSLNTFSRLSYYKNKQTDMRNKSQDMTQQSQPQTVGSKMDGFIMDHLKSIQSQNSVKPQVNLSSDLQAMIRKYEKSQINARDHPMLTNILQGDQSQEQNQHKPASPPNTILSEKDHNDLILILRQQNKLNKPQSSSIGSCFESMNSPVTSCAKTINSINSKSVCYSNASPKPSNLTSNNQIGIGKPDEVQRKVNERKIINIPFKSPSIIKSTDQKTKTPKLKSDNTKKPTGQGKSKKTEGKGPKKTAAKTEPHKDPEEWENVMNAILKQKTPCRGPNALEIALNKSSFEKAFEDSLRKPTTLFATSDKNRTESDRTESSDEKFVNITKSLAISFPTSQAIPKTKKTTHNAQSILKRTPVLKKSSKTKNSDNTSVEALMIQNKIDASIIEKLKQNRIEITKSNSSIPQIEVPEQTRSKVEKAIQERQSEMPKMGAQQRHVESSKTNLHQNNVELIKKTVKNFDKKHIKHTAGETPKKETKQVDIQIKNLNYVGLKQDDPFISGIPNSDYDLLDELIDDDLRKEIGELSSDEDNYNAAAQSFLKQTKTDKKPVSIAYNHIHDMGSIASPLVIANSARSPVCKQNAMTFTQKPTQRKEPVKMTSARPDQSKPVICLNATNIQNVTTHVATNSTQVPSYDNASVLCSTEITAEPSVYIAAVHHPAPIQNVMLIPSDLVYDDYSTIQTPIQTVPNLAPHTYIAVNNAPSISMYQTTQYAAPVISPLIITTAVVAPVVNDVPCVTAVQQPVTKVSQSQYCYTSNELDQSSHYVQGNIVVDGNKLEAKATRNVANHVIDEDVQQKTETKTPAEDSVGKSGERKVLKEVQEKYEKIDYKRRTQKVSDTNFKTQADQERVKNKRLAILNRKTSIFCGMQTIALGYLPLQVSRQVEEKDSDLTDKNDTKDDLILSKENNLQELSGEIKSPATPDSFKENKNETVQVRRILLRSSNKLKSKLNLPSTSPKPSFDKKVKGSPVVSLDTPNETPSENDQSDTETNNKQKRVSKRIRNKLVIEPKDTNKKETNVPRKKTIGSAKVSKQNVHNVSNKIENSTSLQDFDTEQFFDIEAELLGSTISKIIPIDLHSPDPLPEISSSKATEDEIKLLIPDKKDVESLLIHKEQVKQNKEDLPVNNNTNSSEKVNSLISMCQHAAIPETNINVTNETKQTTVMDDNFPEIVIEKSSEKVNSLKPAAHPEININVNLLESKMQHAAISEIKINVTSKTKQKLKLNDNSLKTVKKTTKSSENVNLLKPMIKPAAIEININASKAKQTTRMNKDLSKTNYAINSGLSEANVKEVETEVIVKKNTENINDISFKETISEANPFLSELTQSDKPPTNGPETSISEELPPIEYVHIPTLPQVSYTSINRNENEKKHELNINPVKGVNKNSAKADHLNDNVCQMQNMSKGRNCNIVAPQACTASTAVDDDDDDVKIVGDIPCKPTPQNVSKNIQTKSFEDSIVIENIDNADNNNPLKKTVRIKLGNGKIFKGTVSGYVNINTLLDDPEIKSLLMSQFQQPKSFYSLKLNVNKDVYNGNKVLSAEIQPEIKPHNMPMETVSLLSDDEEEESPQVFETEYGKYKIDSINYGLFKKHQMKLMLKPYVPVRKLTIEETAIKNCFKTNVNEKVNSNIQSLQKCVIVDDDKTINLESPLGVECSKKIVDTNMFSAIPSKYVQGIFKDIENIIDPVNKQPEPAPIVLIDDSSNDSVNIETIPQQKENIDLLKNMLLKDLGVENNLLPATSESTDDVQVTWASEAIDLTDDFVNEPTDAKPRYEKDYHKIINRKCFVKLVRCDNIVDKSKCQPIELKDNVSCENESVMPAPICRSSSFSILENLPVVDEIIEKRTDELDRSSPVMAIYDLIASSKSVFTTNRNNRDFSLVTLKCETEWMTTKKVEYLHGMKALTEKHVSSQSIVVPKLATLILAFIQKENLVKRYTSETRFHSSVISLKRKSKPSSLPIAKISKLDDLADGPQSNNDSLSLTLGLSGTDISNLTITKVNYVDIMLDDIKTDEDRKTEETLVDDFDITPDLSDTDVTKVTVSDIDSDDNMAFTKKETELEAINEIDPYIAEHMQLNKILDVDNNLKLCHTKIFLADSVKESKENSMIDSLNVAPDMSKSNVAKLFKEKLISDLSKETTSEPSQDLADDISIDCPNLDFGMIQIVENNFLHSINNADQVINNNTYQLETSLQQASEELVDEILDTEKVFHKDYMEIAHNANEIINSQMNKNTDSEIVESKIVSVAEENNISKKGYDSTNDDTSVHSVIPLENAEPEEDMDDTEKVNITREVSINPPVSPEIQLEKNDESEEDLGHDLHQPKIDQDCSETCDSEENQTINLSDVTFTTPIYEKTNLETTVENTVESVLANLPDEIIDKQIIEKSFKSQINYKSDVLKLDQESINMQEVKNIAKMSDKEHRIDCTITQLENQNPEHEMRKSIDNTIAKIENHAKNNTTHLPKSNDEIVDALNKMFGEPEDVDSVNKNVLVFEHDDNKILNVANEQDKYCDVNNKQKYTLVENITSITSNKTDTQPDIEIPEKVNTYLPQTTDEIVDALKKIFGESEDTTVPSHVNEVVVTEDIENIPHEKISKIPYNEDLALKGANDLHEHAINASLLNGLSTTEDPDNETVVKGIVDMLSDEIIDNISNAAWNFETHGMKKIENNVEEDEQKYILNNDNLKPDVISKLKTLDQGVNIKERCENVVDFEMPSKDNDDNVRDILDKYLESNGKVEIKGVKYEDPDIGTSYVFSVIEEISEINEEDSTFYESEENNANSCEHVDVIEDIKLIVPKHTYAYSKTMDNEMVTRRSSRNMKRKKDMSDIRTTEKKYRKGKNIDYPKTSASAIAELAYAKEYKRIIDYCSTIQFSYARPFHIETIEVGDMVKAWPINKGPVVEISDSDYADDLLYRDIEDTENIAITDPLQQTLNEEIVNGENINNYKSIDINETNFNMGFGERSGRVIKKIETGIIKLSAATLSDVKQYQPFSMSKVSTDTQKDKLSHFANLISVKEKVRSVFKKTAIELSNELLQDKKYIDSDRQLSKFPFGLTSSEFMINPRVKIAVNVVQVGQLPVTASAQNPVTCDPRVTQVSDASPSQCSDNSPGTQAFAETEYTELTTANITLPIVQEYAQNRHQSPPFQEENSRGTDDNMNDSTLSIVKIELMEEETSQENLENDIYDNDFSPLPNNNVEYSFEDTSNTLFNASVNIHNTSSNTNNTSNNMFNTSNSMDNTFTNMFNNSTNMDSAHSNIENTPLSSESTYTNMDNASTNMYSTSSNIGNSSEMNNSGNMDNASPNMDSNTTNVDNTAMHIDNTSTNMDNTYTSMYNSISSESNSISNTTNVDNSTTSMDDSPINLDNRPSNMNTTHNLENTAYDYTYENIEEYAANIENNNNADNYSTDVDNYASENYSSNVDNYASNVENYTTGVENYATNIESYPSNVENFTNNIDSTNSNIGSNLTNICNTTTNIMLDEPQDLSMANSSQESKICDTFEDNGSSKRDQIAHAMNAAGISPESVITSGADELANLISQSAQTANDYSKPSPVNVMTLQQALAQVLPPPLNQTSSPDNQIPNNPVPQQVLHIVQGSNAQTVINNPNGTHLLHIVQNKNNATSNGLSLVDAGLQQGGNQLIHIVNNGNQNNAQFLKRVNLLTNLTNAQGSNEQKMIQFVCKSADGKSIQLNAGHQRSMVLRLHPTTLQTTPKPTEPQESPPNPATSVANSTNGQDLSQEIKSRSVYEENYAQFIQNSGPTPGSSTTPCQEKATSLPKFNQVFGKQSYQEDQNEMDHNGLQESSECPTEENNGHLEQTSEVNNPPLLVRNTPLETTQAAPNPVQQIKQTISPMNIHTTMHGGVIYTRQIPVNIGGGQTINLITVPSTELVDDSAQKQQTDGHYINQEGEQSSIIKLVPQHISNNSNVPPEENNTQTATSSETNHTPQPQSQPVLTQMRIKLPMLSKGPHIVPGARLVRPSFFQIQRNVIAGTNQPVYQQLVLTTAPSLGQTIRLPTQQAQSPQAQPILVQSSPHPQSSPHIPVQQVQHAPSSQHVLSAQQAHSAPPTPQPQTVQPELTKQETEPNSELNNLTLEQLREFDMVLEQVKERSVQPTPSTTPIGKSTPADSTDGPALKKTSVSESTQQVLYSVGNNQPTNVVSYVNRKSTITSATTSFVRSPDSSGIVDTPSSSTQVQITHTVTSKSSTAEGGSAVVAHPKKKKKKKKSSSSSSALASLGSPSKANTLKPQEDEQTTQRILYILAEYKEQVENSPDKNKPAPRRRNQFPPTTGSKRKRSHCSSRAACRHEGVDMSEMHGEHGEDSLITLGSEDSSNGTTFSECTECQENHSPENSPTKVVRRLTFEHETTTQITQTQTIPQRNVIVGDRQTITVARTTTATTAKPTTTVLMPANYLLPVSMIKGGQQIAIMTNRGPKILVGAGDTNAGALLFQRLIGPGLKPVLTRPGVRHIRLPATALHNLQTFNIQTTPVTQVQPPDSTIPQAPTPAPPDLVDTRAMSSPWQDREAQDKPERGPSPDCTEPWNLPSSSIADDYGYEEIVRTDNMERTVLDAIPDRYSPDMEAQRIFDKMFDVDSKKSMYDSSRCGYDIDTSDGDDKPFPQVVQQRKDGRHHRVTHVSTAALRHKYAILEHELRLQKSLSEECEDLGVDSPSASDLFPEADILFGAPSPAHEQTIDHCNTPSPVPIPQTTPQPEKDDQITTDQLLTHTETCKDDLDLNLDDVGEIVTVGEDGVATIPIINAEEFARSHPNTTFHTEPEDGEIPPFTIAQGIKGRHITFHANRVPGTVVMAPQTTVISQATVNSNDANNTVKFIDIDNMINSMPCPPPASAQSVLVKDPGVKKPTKFETVKDTGISASRSKSKDSSSVPRTSSKFDSLKETSYVPRSSSKFDSLKVPGASSSSRSSSKFDSLKDSGSHRSVSKFDSLKDPVVPPKPLSKFDSLLTDSKLHLATNTARQVVHTRGHGTQVIRRLRYDERTNTRTNTRFHFEEPRKSISDEVKMRNDRAMVESMGDNASSPGQPELFWDSTTTERHERRFHFSESEKVAKSPFDELLNDSSAYGPHTRLDSVIKAARPERAFERTSFEGISVSGSSDESRPLRTYPPKRVHTQHTQDTERHFTLKTTTTTTHHHEVDRTTKTTHHHELGSKKTVPRCQESEGRRRTGRGLVKRGCSCCNGSSAPPKKRSRPKKPSPPDFTPNTKSDSHLT